MGDGFSRSMLVILMDLFSWLLSRQELYIEYAKRKKIFFNLDDASDKCRSSHCFANYHKPFINLAMINHSHQASNTIN